MKWNIYPTIESLPKDVEKLAEQIEKDGGKVLSIYQEPYGNNWQIFALLPLMKITPTPFQRDLSNQHVERLQEVIIELKRFLDPIIVIRTENGQYWTPNGNHRREAMAQLNRNMISAIVVPDVGVAYQILSLNTEKAHNVREKALEVIRMYRGLIEENPDAKENDYAFHFEEPYLITLGVIYEKREHFSGSAYVPVLKKVDNFFEDVLTEALKKREKRAQLLEEVDTFVEPIVQNLKERGINHPFLKQAVVSKVNPVKRKRIVELTYEETLQKMLKALKKLDVSKITLEELAALVSEE